MKSLIALILMSAASVGAQPVAASISTVPQPSVGHPVFDASGNTYYLSAPPGESATELTPGGGRCVGQTGSGRIGILPCLDVDVTKAGPSGNQIWAARLGGPTVEKGTALAVDTNGNVAFTGSTGGQFPTTPGAAIESSTSATAFAAKVTADGSKFLYSTSLPESLAASSAIAVDAAGSAYIAGKTSAGHAFVLKLSPDGSTIDYNVTLAGSGADDATAITVDPAGNAFVAGQTTSPDFPVTAGAFQRQLKGTQNSFLIKLSPSGSVLSSTYFGGSGSDSPSSIAVDGASNIDLAGYTSSADFPATQGTMQPSVIVPPWNSFAPAGFVAQFAPDGISLKWASYVMSSDLRPLGANFDVGVSALGVGSAGDIYIGGLTGPGFPVTPSAPVICFQGTANHTNGFLAHLNSNGALLDATYLWNSAVYDIDFVGGLLPLGDGSVLIAWHQTGLVPSDQHAIVNGVVSKVRFGSGGWTAPGCLSTDVLSSATLSGSGGIAPGELVTLTGFGIGPDIGVVYQTDAQGNVPTQLAGVQVLFDGVPVPVLYVQSRQINAIAPGGLAVNGTTQVTVNYNNRQFGPVLAYTTFGSPGIFRLQIWQSAQAVAFNQDGTLNGPTNPAARGSIVAVLGTGYGQTDPTCQSGGLNLPHPYAVPLSPGISALIHYVDPNLSGEQLAPVEYAGSAPGLLCGIVQITFQVPENVAPGAFSFSPWIAGNGTIGSPTGATISVK